MYANLMYVSHSYSPEYFLMEDVIVVTINYRLHALGFASLPSMGISGNAGLKDQQMALEWIHENISNFNGDPQNICLFGESAGGSSVYLQTLSEKSRKFIKSAICQSGTAIDAWLFQRDGEDKTKRMGKAVGAKGDSDQDIYDALMQAKPEDLFRSLLKLPNPDDLRRNLPFVMKPIVERESDDAFMTQSPLELIKNQAGQISFPMMFGKTSGDGMTMVSFFMRNLKTYNDDRVKLIPQNVDVDPESEEAKELGERISRFYFGEKGVTHENVQQFIQLLSDFYFTVPQTMHARLNQIHHPGMNQFLYDFDFDGKLNFLKKALKMTKYEGACHFDDLSYLFRWDFQLNCFQILTDFPFTATRSSTCT
jgi:carboxylesterase type B